MSQDVRTNQLNYLLDAFQKDRELWIEEASLAIQSKRSPISKMTQSLLVIVTFITLSSSAILVSMGASPQQLLVSLGGELLLYVLVGVCILLDHSRKRALSAFDPHDLYGRMDKVSNELKQVDELHAQWEKKIEGLKARLENGELECLALDKEVAIKREVLADEAESVLRLQSDQQTIQEVIENSRTNLAEIETQTKSLIDELSQRNLELQSKKVDVATQERLIEEILEQKSAIEKFLTDRQSTKEAIDQEIVAQFGRLTEIQQSVERRLVEQTELDNLLLSVQDEIASLESQLAVTQGLIGCNQSELEQIALQQTAKSDALDRIDAAIIEGEAMVSNRLELINSLDDTIGDLQKSIESLSIKTESERTNLAIAVAFHHEKLGQNNELFKLEKTIRERIQTAEGLLIAVQDKTKIAIESRTVLEDSLAAVQTELDRLSPAQKELAEIESQIAAQKKQIDIYHADELVLLGLIFARNDELARTMADQAITEIEMGEWNKKLEVARKDLLELEFSLNTAEVARDAAAEEAHEWFKVADDAERRAHLMKEKADSLAEQVQNRASEIYENKQILIELRSEIRQLESTKEQLNGVDQELQSAKESFAQIESNIAARQSEATRMEEQLCELLQAVEEAQTQRDGLQDYNQILEEQSSELKRRLQDSLTEFESKRTAVAELFEQQQDLEQDVTALQESLQIVQDQYADVERDRDALNRDVQRKQTELAELSTRLLDKSNALASTEISAGQIQLRLDSLNSEIGNAERIKREIEERLIEMQSQEQSARAQLDSVKECVTIESSRYSEIQAAVQSATAVKIGLERNIQSLQAEIVASNSHQLSSMDMIAQLEKKKELAVAEMDRLTNETSVHQAIFNRLKDDLDKLTIDKCKLEEDWKLSASSLEKMVIAIEDKAAELGSLEHATESIRKEGQLLKQAAEESQNRLDGSNRDLEEAKSTLRALLSDIARQKQAKEREMKLRDEAVQESEYAIEKLREQQVALRTDMKAIADQLHEKQNSLKFLESDIERVKSERVTLRSEIVEQKNQIDLLSNERAVLKDAIEDLQQQNKTQSKRLMSIQSETSTAESRRDTLKEQMMKLTRDVADAQSVCKQWENYASTLQNDSKALQQANSRLEDQVRQLQNRRESIQSEQQFADINLQKTKTEVATFRAELQSIQEKIAANAFELERLSKEKAKAAQLQQVVLQMEAKVEDQRRLAIQIDDHIAEGQSKSQALQQSIAKMEQDRRGLQNELQKVSHNLEIAMRKENQTQASSEELQSKEKELAQIIARHLRDIEKLELESKTATEKLIQSQNEKCDIIDGIEQLKMDLETIELRKADANSEVKRIEEAVQLRMQDLAELNKTEETLRGRLSSLKADIGEKEAKAKSSEERVIAALNQLRIADDRRCELSELNVTLEKEIGIVQQQLSDQKTLLETMNEEKVEATKQVAAARHQTEMAIAQTETAIQQFESIKKGTDIEQSNVIELQRELGELAKHREQLQGKISHLKTELTEKEKCRNASIDEIEELNQQKMKLSKDIERFRSETSELQLQYQSQALLKEELESQLQELKELKNQLISQNHERVTQEAGGQEEVYANQRNAVQEVGLGAPKAKNELNDTEKTLLANIRLLSEEANAAASLQSTSPFASVADVTKPGIAITSEKDIWHRTFNL